MAENKHTRRTHTHMEQTVSAGRTIPTDLNCHGSAVTTSRAGAAAGHARLNMSRTDCLFTQCNDKDGSFRVPPRQNPNVHVVAHKEASFSTGTHSHTHSSA